MNSTLRVHRLNGTLQEQNARVQWKTRHALVIELSRDGHIGRGECSPLPGYSSESLEACVSLARSLSDRARLADALENLSALPPALAFALDAARRELDGDAVVTGPPLELASLKSNTKGVRKIKIGRKLDAELAEARKQKGKLRFDANQTLGDYARHALAVLAELDTEFLEEPVPFAELEALSPSPVPIALDESLQGPDGPERLDAALTNGWAHIAVIKPAALGPERTKKLVQVAHAYGAPVIISHLFGGPLAYAAEAWWAFDSGSRTHAHGLGRHSGLVTFDGWSTELGLDGILTPWRGGRWPVESAAPS